VGTESGGMWSYAQGDTSVTDELSIEEYGTTIDFNVYPNPANETFYIQLENGEQGNYLSAGRRGKYSYELIDQIGRCVKKQDNIYSSTTTVNTSALERGVYGLKINIASQHHQLVKKIVIEK
jgi:hypothetical protein